MGEGRSYSWSDVGYFYHVTKTTCLMDISGDWHAKLSTSEYDTPVWSICSHAVHFTYHPNLV